MDDSRYPGPGKQVFDIYQLSYNTQAFTGSFIVMNRRGSPIPGNHVMRVVRFTPYSASGSQTEIKLSINPATSPSPSTLVMDVRSSTEPSGR